MFHVCMFLILLRPEELRTDGYPTSLVAQVKEGNLAKVKRILNCGVHVDIRDEVWNES